LHPLKKNGGGGIRTLVPHSETPINQASAETGAAKSAALTPVSDGISAIMALPLTPDEKAQAVRALLAERRGQ
jgi:hypothetical protein